MKNNYSMRKMPGLYLLLVVFVSGAVATYPAICLKFGKITHNMGPISDYLSQGERLGQGIRIGNRSVRDSRETAGKTQGSHRREEGR